MQKKDSKLSRRGKALCCRAGNGRSRQRRRMKRRKRKKGGRKRGKRARGKEGVVFITFLFPSLHDRETVGPAFVSVLSSHASRSQLFFFSFFLWLVFVCLSALTLSASALGSSPAYRFSASAGRATLPHTPCFLILLFSTPYAACMWVLLLRPICGRGLGSRKKG